MFARLIVAALVAGSSFACSNAGQSSKPSSSPSSSAPALGGGTCPSTQNPVVCTGGTRQCEMDENGCERCVCQGLTPLEPG